MICRNCVGGSQNQNGQTGQTPSDEAIVRLSDLKLRTPPSAKAKNVNPYLVYATEAGHFRRVYFTCVKCSNSTAWVKFKTYRRWDVYGYCHGCHAKYKKVGCKTKSITNQTTLSFQLTTDETFSIPESTSGLSSDDDIHPHYQKPKRRSNGQRTRAAERRSHRERMPSQGDAYDPRNLGMFS